MSCNNRSQLSETDSVCDICKLHQENTQYYEAVKIEYGRHLRAISSMRYEHGKVLNDLYKKYSCDKHQEHDDKTPNTPEHEFCFV